MHTVLLLMFLAVIPTCTGYAVAGEGLRSGPKPLAATQLERWSDSQGFKRGIASAEANIQQGRLIFRSSGFAITPKSMSSYQGRRKSILARYNISFSNHGCMGDESGEDSGYNHRMAQEVLIRYGIDFWQRVDQEARDGTRDAP